MSPQAYRISHKAGYVRRRGNVLHFNDTQDFWASPAFMVVDIPAGPDYALQAAAMIFASIAHPALTPQGQKERVKTFMAILAWQWRLAAHYGFLQKKDIPSCFMEIKTDAMYRRLHKMQRALDKRLQTSRFFLFSLMLAGVSTTQNTSIRYSGPKSVLGISSSLAKSRLGSYENADMRITADNIRNRMWQKVKHVLHLVSAMHDLMSDPGNNIPKLLQNPDWINNFLRDAEIRRCHLLPTLEHPINVESTVQFRPFG